MRVERSSEERDFCEYFIGGERERERERVNKNLIFIFK